MPNFCRGHHEKGRNVSAAQILAGDTGVRWAGGVEIPPQPHPASTDLGDKIAGMMLGLAIGDALGNTSESMVPTVRRHQYGWIDDYLPNRHAGCQRIGLPSD